MPTFTERVRNELAHVVAERACCVRAETSALLRLGGALHVSGATPDSVGGAGWVVSVSPNAVARRLHSALVAGGVRCTIEVHQPTALRPGTYRLTLPRPVAPALARYGVTDAEGRPLDGPPQALVSAPHDRVAYVRGALLATGSVSDPQAQVHLEIGAPTAATAAALRGLVERCGGHGARVADSREGSRVYLKSGAEIGAVLARTGASSAFLAWDGERLRRELRGEANRAANADRANLGRAVDAAARDCAAITALVERVGWEGLPDGLRETALARLANPEASLSELGLLHDPPVGKATVHRRLSRLTSLASEAPR